MFILMAKKERKKENLIQLQQVYQKVEDMAVEEKLKK